MSGVLVLVTALMPSLNDVKRNLAVDGQRAENVRLCLKQLVHKRRCDGLPRDTALLQDSG